MRQVIFHSLYLTFFCNANFHFISRQLRHESYSDTSGFNDYFVTSMMFYRKKKKTFALELPQAHLTEGKEGEVKFPGTGFRFVIIQMS